MKDKKIAEGEIYSKGSIKSIFILRKEKKKLSDSFEKRKKKVLAGKRESANLPVKCLAPTYLQLSTTQR